MGITADCILKRAENANILIDFKGLTKVLIVFQFGIKYYLNTYPLLSRKHASFYPYGNLYLRRLFYRFKTFRKVQKWWRGHLSLLVPPYTLLFYHTDTKYRPTTPDTGRQVPAMVFMEKTILRKLYNLWSPKLLGVTSIALETCNDTTGKLK